MSRFYPRYCVLYDKAVFGIDVQHFLYSTRAKSRLSTVFFARLISRFTVRASISRDARKRFIRFYSADGYNARACGVSRFYPRYDTVKFD